MAVRGYTFGIISLTLLSGRHGLTGPGGREDPGHPRHGHRRRHRRHLGAGHAASQPGTRRQTDYHDLRQGGISRQDHCKNAHRGPANRHFPSAWAKAVAAAPAASRAGSRDYKLTDYPGKIHQDGTAALIDLIEHSPQSVTVIAIGPVQTLAAALDRRPDIAGKAAFVGMHGSVRKGYGGGPKLSAEYNVKACVAAARKVLSAPWRQIAITPLDTCGAVNLSGKRFQSLKDSPDPLVKAMLEKLPHLGTQRSSRRDSSQQYASSIRPRSTWPYPGARPLHEIGDAPDRRHGRRFSRGSIRPARRCASPRHGKISTHTGTSWSRRS